MTCVAESSNAAMAASAAVTTRAVNDRDGAAGAVRFRSPCAVARTLRAASVAAASSVPSTKRWLC